MKELQKKFVNIGLAAPYSIPVNLATAQTQQQLSTQAAQHLNQIQMQNYLLSGLQLQNSSGKSPAKPAPHFQLIKQNQQKLQFSKDYWKRFYLTSLVVLRSNLCSPPDWNNEI